MVHEKTLAKKHIHYLIPSPSYQDFWQLLQNPKVPKIVLGLSNHAQRFTPPYYLDVDNPFNKKFMSLSSCLFSCSVWVPRSCIFFSPIFNTHCHNLHIDFFSLCRNFLVELFFVWIANFYVSFKLSCRWFLWGDFFF